MTHKAQELSEYLREVENSCFEKEQILDENERLDMIIADLQKKNCELSQMMNNKYYNEAQDFKDKAINSLTKSRFDSQRSS